ncbi:MAG: hypothetical protein JW727_03740 [Candidatus Aenigmarchaeota archaeon]|nr:hypothetical protein [Candidatus Aenigmarchaeota archaeon]
MPKQDLFVWLFVALSVCIAIFFPYLVFLVQSPVSASQLAILMNLVLPLLFIAFFGEFILHPHKAKSHGKGHRKAPRAKASVLQLVGLKVPVWLVSVLLGLCVMLPGFAGLIWYSGAMAYPSTELFEGIFYNMFLVLGAAIAVISYTHLCSRNLLEKRFLTFQLHAPVLGVLFGLIGAFHVLLMMVFGYFWSYTEFFPTLFYGAFAQTFYDMMILAGVNLVMPFELEFIFGFFLIEMVTLLTIYFTRRTYGSDHVMEQGMLARNLALAMFFYAVLFVLIPMLFYPFFMTSVFGYAI